MDIRFENPGDVEQIHELNQAAFEGDTEARLVDKLRESGIDQISLVAEEDGAIIGHILFTPVSLDRVSGISIAALAPMAIRPDWQGKAVGTELVKKGLKICQQADYDAVVVLGHASYYPRFGFEPAADYGIRSEYDVPREAFMIKLLKPGVLKDRTGTIKYNPIFSQFS